MIRVTNISGQVIGIMIEKEGSGYSQYNLYPNRSLLVRSCIGQIYNLCDPSKNILKVEEAE